MLLLEHDAKTLLGRYGLATPPGFWAKAGAEGTRNRLPDGPWRGKPQAWPGGPGIAHVAPRGGHGAELIGGQLERRSRSGGPRDEGLREACRVQATYAQQARRASACGADAP